MELPWLIPILAALFAAALEARRHRRLLDAIPQRIHVNGTRGKSSVVRLVAAGLRAGGLRVVAKTTGSAARVILPDGSEADMRGRRRPSLGEYRQVVALAAREGADAVVIECMAVRPEMQRVTERHLVRATIGVLTNAVPDHLGVMGGTLGEIAFALGQTIPTGGLLLTGVGPGSAPEVLTMWASRAAELGTVIRSVDAGAAALPVRAATARLGPLSGGPATPEYLEWPENVAMALAVCEAAGVAAEKALEGMRAVRSDPGALRVFILDGGPGGPALPPGGVWLVGAFGANDPASTRRAAELMASAAVPAATVGVLNTRADRGERTLQWCRELSSGEFHVDRLVVTGPHARAAVRLLARRGWPSSRLRAMGACSAEEITRVALAALAAAPPAVLSAAHSGGMVLGMGNMAGAGAALLSHWASIGIPAQVRGGGRKSDGTTAQGWAGEGGDG